MEKHLQLLHTEQLDELYKFALENTTTAQGSCRDNHSQKDVATPMHLTANRSAWKSSKMVKKQLRFVSVQLKCNAVMKMVKIIS